MRARVTVFLAVLMLVSAAPTWAQRDSDIYSRPKLDVRMFCPVDIEAFAVELDRRGAIIPEYAGADEVREKLGDQPTLPNRFTLDISDEPESRVMRRVAYGILANWPAAQRGVRDAIVGERSLKGLVPAFRMDVLHAVWRQWKAERMRVLTQLFAAHVVDPSVPVFTEFRNRWGPQPQLEGPLSDASEQDIPPSVDCKWYMRLYNSDGFLFEAVLEKHTGLLADWEDATETTVRSRLFDCDAAFFGQYPDVLTITFTPDGSDLILSGQYLLGLKDLIPHRGHVRLEADPSKGKCSPTYTFRYPILDQKAGEWRYVDGIVSCAEFPEWQEADARVAEHVFGLSEEGMGSEAKAWCAAFSGNR